MMMICVKDTLTTLYRRKMLSRKTPYLKVSPFTSNSWKSETLETEKISSRFSRTFSVEIFACTERVTEIITINDYGKPYSYQYCLLLSLSSCFVTFFETQSITSVISVLLTLKTVAKRDKMFSLIPKSSSSLTRKVSEF